MMFTTLFDRNYLLRGLTMLDSLLEQSPSSQITVLALDWETRKVLTEVRQSSRVNILSLDSLDSESLWAARRSRSYRDFCWTLSSVLCRHLLIDHDEVIYLDADICFFNSPNDLLDLCRSGEVAAVPHGFPQRLRASEVNGIFNVQWVYFAGGQGRDASHRWAEQCLDRCELAPEEGIVGDQKYLDEWPDLYDSFVSIDNPGAGVAPWNHEVRDPRLSNGNWIVGDDTRLVFYHFHGLSISSSGSVVLSGPTYSEVRPLPRELYEEYLQRLSVNWNLVQHLVPEPDPATWKIRPRPTRLLRSFASRIR